MKSEITEHSSLNDIIVRYLSGEASDSEVEQLLEWILQSDENKREFLSQKQVWDNLVEPFDRDSIDVDVAEKILNDRIRGKHSFTSFVKKIFLTWSRIAAILIIPIFVVAIYLLISKVNVQPIPRTIATTYGCSMETTLPDGSKVWINANSALSYNEPFNTELREVSLKGEAYFEVNSDKKHPFVVSTSDITVTATGTAFNVNSYNCNSVPTSVTLVTGNVKVDAANETYNMTPGQHLTVKNGAIKVSENISTDKYCSWRNGILDFDDDTLQDIFLRLEQIYNIRFIVTNPIISDYRYHAKFNGETLSEILHLIEMTSPVKCQIIDKSDKDTKTLIEVALAK